eukprot:CAMPEP_0196803456 /NCGR_PEP_ID=MMETSP1362-20130617/2878_1 /TAXON_ID=163516 /ORGANISM="Leptocylindrus danicus, Strain CCMP1856" /LENGTH=243 /DNA_ID=CAMNT_0042175067 /DNA_START=44 /DNA_END=775 /DNA_ORIENTATION=+
MIRKSIIITGTLVAIASLIVAFIKRQPVSSKFSSASGNGDSAYDGDKKYVTCGSAIKLTHKETGYLLNSQSDANWSGRGSGQQVVTLTPVMSSHDSLWLVREAHGRMNKDICAPSTPVKCSTNIRLTHLSTNKNLHSHPVESQMRGGREVSAFSPRGDGEGDIKDNWIIECERGAKFWERDRPVRLLHSHTLDHLSSDVKNTFNERNCGRNCPIQNHIEVAGVDRDGKSELWLATLGVHFSAS